MHHRISHSLRWSIVFAPLLGLFAGCAEQPYGYVFTPKDRDKINVARQTGDFISAFYDHADAASRLLEDAGLTSNYRSILPDGWVDYTVYDGQGRPLASSYIFARNYLDKQYYGLMIDTAAITGALRHPAKLAYSYTEIASVQNNITNEFLPQLNDIRNIEIGYARNYTNLSFIDAWFSIKQVERFEQELEISVGGQSSDVSFFIYLQVPWTMKVTDFSIDPDDQQGHIVIDGLFPIMTEEGDIQNCHVSGEFRLDKEGKGSGDVWLFGEPTARITFTGRAFGFKGKFTLFSENHEITYNL